MKKRLKTAATLPRDMGRLECAALVRPGSPLHSRIVGASLTLNRADLSAVILLEGLADAALDELFP